MHDIRAHPLLRSFSLHKGKQLTAVNFKDVFELLAVEREHNTTSFQATKRNKLNRIEPYECQSQENKDMFY